MISPTNKGLGTMPGPLDLAEVAALGWNLLREDLSLPIAVLKEERLNHNLRWMQRFTTAYDVRFCPHGKTTMAPKLFARQLAGGAWGITLATAPQVLAAYTHGVRRILMANQLVGRQNMEIVSRLLEDPSFEFYCLVDSAAGVDQLGRFFTARGQRLNVLLEIGTKGGRAGVRTAEQIGEVVDSLVKWSSTLVLAGIELFEGVLKSETEVRKFLHDAVGVATRLAHEERFGRSPVILSGAGSAWFDVVAETFGQADLGQPKEVVLRPGCYLTHDAGSYVAAHRRIHADNVVAPTLGEGLLPALEVWAYVQSIPEPDLAIVGLGKRDASFDSGLPVPRLHFRPGEVGPVSVPPDWNLTKIMDQHAFLHMAKDGDLRVGDMVGFDISHPCLTFDKWRYLPIVDAEYRVVEMVETFF